VNIHLVHHAADITLVAALAEAAAKVGFARVDTPAAAGLALVLVSRAALQEGLGRGPAEVLAAGVPVLTVLVDEDPLPPDFPIHRKHAPIARDVPALVALLTDRREDLGARQIDSKRDLFGYGVLLALLHRT
jgi:hypothetical protein